MKRREDFRSEFLQGLVYGAVVTIVSSLVVLYLATHGFINLSQGYAGFAEAALIVIGVTWGSGAVVSLGVEKGSRTWFIGGVVAGTILVVIVAAIVLAALGSTSRREEDYEGTR
jgi:O-antigen ligase